MYRMLSGVFLETGTNVRKNKHFLSKLNFQVIFNIVLSDTLLLRLIHHGFIHSVSLLVHNKHQHLGQLSVSPGGAAQSFVALTGKPPAQSPQICKGRSPKDKKALMKTHNPKILWV